jgi:hypothetical protein
MRLGYSDLQTRIYTTNANHQLSQTSFLLFLWVPRLQFYLLLYLLFERMYRTVQLAISLLCGCVSARHRCVYDVIRV